MNEPPHLGGRIGPDEDAGLASKIGWKLLLYTLIVVVVLADGYWKLKRYVSRLR